MHQQTQEVLINNCNKSMITEIMKMRYQGVPYKTIAFRTNISTTTVTRYTRVYELYGLEAFADD